MDIKNINSTNFNGYKNLLTNNASLTKNRRLSFLSIQLDNIGKNDLDTWNTIQRNLLGEKNPSDVMTIVMRKLFNNHFLLLGEDKDLDPYCVKQGSYEEKMLMKTYTWLSDLTKRIMNDNNLIKDKGCIETIRMSLINILPFSGNDIEATNAFVYQALEPENHPQEEAKIIYDAIDDIMLDYLL